MTKFVEFPPVSFKFNVSPLQIGEFDVAVIVGSELTTIAIVVESTQLFASVPMTLYVPLAVGTCVGF